MIGFWAFLQGRYEQRSFDLLVGLTQKTTFLSKGLRGHAVRPNTSHSLHSNPDSQDAPSFALLLGMRKVAFGCA